MTSLRNFFELFELPALCRLDAKALESAYRQVQQRVHPDRFASASEADRRASMQWATAANEAYQTLRHPVRRAAHLLALAGHDVNAHSSAAMLPGFLMQQLEWREALEEAAHGADGVRMQTLEGDVAEAFAAKVDHLARLIDDAHDFPAAVVAVRELMFIEKFKNEVADALDVLAA
jgi:molecular chaperone HscB